MQVIQTEIHYIPSNCCALDLSHSWEELNILVHVVNLVYWKYKRTDSEHRFNLCHNVPGMQHTFLFVHTTLAQTMVVSDLIDPACTFQGEFACCSPVLNNTHFGPYPSRAYVKDRCCSWKKTKLPCKGKLGLGYLWGKNLFCTFTSNPETKHDLKKGSPTYFAFICNLKLALFASFVSETHINSLAVIFPRSSPFNALPFQTRLSCILFIVISA